ncbi:Pvc16 family protein [Xanthobacter agilis]|uniref:Pvc16 N-terminal domain-containing protein n=1 Tax=Xanthobacter agilis TaxID=47492 RepID=A0ABU0LD65_XANAG|nr:Pvc16 family protein [Xanthobacter agilis]MDQ0505087.1 hypothetical protein [Xanthobacter agilis]
MSAADLPAIAVEALRTRLETAIADLPGQPSVLVSSPWRAPEFGLFIHLHALALETRAPHPPLHAAGAHPLGATPPRPAWTLRLLIGAFASDDGAIHRLMGRAALALHTDPLLTSDALADAARRLGLPDPTASAAQVASDEIGCADMSRLWQRFAPMRYSLSAAWRVTLA